MIRSRSRAWLIDGAPALADFEKLQRRLANALTRTLENDAKFTRFATGVLGADASVAAKSALRAELEKVEASRRGYNDRNLPRDGASPFGPGRVDAFGAIMNEVTVTFAKVADNHAPANAPVSYPFLWDTPQHDRVQWNGAAENTVAPLLRPLIGTAQVGALGRNTGEVLGVFGTVDATQEGSPLQLRSYPSSVNRPNLIALEELLRKLWSPQWPVGLPSIDQSARALGEGLFKRNCQTCHALIQRDADNRRVTADMRAVGTDQAMASNFAGRMSKSGVLQGRKYDLIAFRRFGPVEPARDLLFHMVQRVILRPSVSPAVLEFPAEEQLARLQLDMQYRVFAEIQVGDRKLTGAFKTVKIVDNKVQEALGGEALRVVEGLKTFQFDAAALDDTGRFVAPDDTSIRLDDLPGLKHKFGPAGTQLMFTTPAITQFAYKARPLNGIWATAPYLHNGSVPNLDELLKPPSKRLRKFKVGSREFDPDRVGFRTDQGSVEIDTSLPGNSNAGHDYAREFRDEERKQLIEYLKSL